MLDYLWARKRWEGKKGIERRRSGILYYQDSTLVWSILTIR